MAIISPVVTHTGMQDGSAFKAVWPNLTTTDAFGAPVEAIDNADRSVAVTGTFGVGGTLTMEGSNDGTNYFALTDPQGNPIAITAAGIEQITEITAYMRPAVTVGDGTTDLTITSILRRNNPLRT